MKTAIVLNGTSYNVLEAFDAYLQCIAVVESGGNALRGTHSPEVVEQIGISIRQNAVDAMKFYNAMVAGWEAPAAVPSK